MKISLKKLMSWVIGIYEMVVMIIIIIITSYNIKSFFSPTLSKFTVYLLLYYSPNLS